MTNLKNLIVFENEIKPDDRELATLAGLNIYTFNEVIEKGKVFGAEEGKENKIMEPSTDDVFMLSYTSGTTGDPKGVKVSH